MTFRVGRERQREGKSEHEVIIFNRVNSPWAWRIQRDLCVLEGFKFMRCGMSVQNVLVTILSGYSLHMNLGYAVHEKQKEEKWFWSYQYIRTCLIGARLENLRLYENKGNVVPFCSSKYYLLIPSWKFLVFKKNLEFFQDMDFEKLYQCL